MNVRTAMVIGAYELDWGKKKKGTIPKSTDRSMFSCERYQFFLDAPFEICNMCCNVMKKNPAKDYQKKTHRMPMTAQMASESRLRTQTWLKQGCNAFDAKKPISTPMAFWTEQDVLLYLYLHGEEMVGMRKRMFEKKHPGFSDDELNEIYKAGEWNVIASVYGEIVKENEVEGQMDFEDLGLFDLGRPVLKTTGLNRTGCMFCLYGVHLEKEPNRLQRMKETHPKQYDYIMRSESDGGLGYKEKLDWINEHGNMNIKYE